MNGDAGGEGEHEGGRHADDARAYDAHTHTHDAHVHDARETAHHLPPFGNAP